MGHYEKREKADVRAKIDQCNDLKSKLEDHKANAETEQNVASESKTSCYDIVYAEADNLSGLYHEENHMTYRNTFLGKIDSLDGGAATMIAAIQKIIDALDAKIAELEADLYEDVWVPDESDYNNGSSEAS